MGQLLALQQVNGIMRLNVTAGDKVGDRSSALLALLDRVGQDIIGGVELRSPCVPCTDLHLVRHNCYSFVWNVKMEFEGMCDK